MSNALILDNHVIQKDIKGILTKLKSDIINGKLKSIRFMGDEVRITCPFHKDGLENRASCDIYVGDEDKLTWGTYHCFTCGAKGSLVDIVAGCLEISVNNSKRWLINNFTDYVLEEGIKNIDDRIVLRSGIKPVHNNHIDESVLSTFQSWHPYLQQRKLSKDVCQQFDVKYDPKTECVVFPVRDMYGKLSFLTRRSVKDKQFIIDSNITKDVYLLYDIIKNNTKTVYVVESQINALTLRSWGYPAIALMGTGTEHQYQLLRKCSILHYVLCFDGDDAGRKGIRNFVKNVGDNSFISIIKIPEGKDVNDLTKEEFNKLNNE